jgi:PAS domain S-box-containing protein
MMVILENMDGVMAATVDALGKFIYVTASAKGMCGYSPADMCGQFVLTFVHPDDVKKVGELVQAVRVGRGDHHERAGRVVGEEVIELVRFQMRRKDGSFVWLEMKHTRSMQEKIPVNVMIFQEINEVVQGEMNDAFVKWEAGKKRAEDIKSFRSINALLKRTSGKSSSSTHSSNGAIGGLSTVSGGGTPTIADEEEELTTLTLDEVEAAKEEDPKKDERYMLPVNLFDSVNMLVIATDTNGRVVHWNRMSAGLTGYSSAEAIGHLLQDFVSPEYRSLTPRAIKQVLSEKKPRNNLEITLMTKLGGCVDVILSIAQWVDTSGRAGDGSGVLGVLIAGSQEDAHFGQRYRLIAENANEIFKWVKGKAGDGGSFGRVFLARRFKDNQVVAIKKVDMSGLKRDAREKIQREPDILKSLHHPNIIGYTLIHSHTHTLILSHTHTLIHTLSYTLIHTLSYSLIHTLSYSLIHTLSYSLIHTLSYTHSHTHSYIHSHTHSYIHSHTHTLILSHTHTLIHTLSYTLIHTLSYTHSHTHSYIHSHTHTLIHILSYTHH